MPRPLIAIKKFAILCHRWMGVAFCLLFSWWFISGIFMMYWDFPEVGESDRLAHSIPLDPSQVKLSAQQAFKQLDTDAEPGSVRLAVFDGRPAYYFRYGRRLAVAYADNGAVQSDVPEEMNRRIAAAWTGRPAAEARAETLDEPDQWTVGGVFRSQGPLLKYSWPDGQQVYTSESTGEVVQYTTRSSRLFAYLGAIPHWMYFTPLRKDSRLWTRVVIWSSGAATVAALLGLIVGVWMYSPSQKYRNAGEPSGIPYTGQKRLHMLFGLFFGIIACTWAFSGMLSLEPFPLTTGGGPRGRGPGPGLSAGRIAGALRGRTATLDEFEAKHPRNAIQQATSEMKVKQLEFTSFAGEPVYLATGDDRRTMVIPMEGAPQPEFNRKQIMNLVSGAGPLGSLAEIRVMPEYDAYYLDRHGERPLPVILARLNDRAGTRFYIDPRSARVVGNYSSRSWMNRWLYHGLHSLDFPWLYTHRPAWDFVVLVLLLGGTSLSVTSVIIGFQFLRRKLSFQRGFASSVSEEAIRTP